MTKNYNPVSLFSVFSKVSEKLVSNELVYLLAKCGLFPNFQYGFRSSWSTVDLLTVVSDKIAGISIGLGLLELWHLIYLMLSTGFSRLVFFTISGLVEFHIKYLALLLFFSIRVGCWTWNWSRKHWYGAGSGSLISMLNILNLFHLASLITLVLLMWKYENR